MKTILSAVAAGLFALSTIAAASACPAHDDARTADISKPITTVDGPMTPKPETGS